MPNKVYVAVFIKSYCSWFINNLLLLFSLETNKMGKVKHLSPEQGTVTSYGFYAIFGFVTYFIWCDLSFFGELSAEKTSELRLKNSTLVSRNTIKLRMLKMTHFALKSMGNIIFHLNLVIRGRVELLNSF